MKPIRLLTAVAFLLASAASATVFQPANDRQLADRSETVVVATVRDASSRLRADGYVVTDYRLDVERTIKGTAAGTITVSEIGGVAGSRFTFISDSAVYRPGEQVMVFLKKRGDGTYFTTSMAMGKFSYTRNAIGEAVLTRSVSELPDEPARLADGFEAFVRGISKGQLTSAAYTTTFAQLHPRVTASASSYCTFATDQLNHTYPIRWESHNPAPESPGPINFYEHGTLAGVNTSAGITSGLAAWTNDASSNIVLSDAGADASTTPSGEGHNVIYLGYTGSDPANAICDGADGCTVGSGTGEHDFHSEHFFSIGDADIIIRPSVTSSTFDAIITHELGHAIGFRHSNQGIPQDNNAVMASPVNAGFGASLGSWDHDAIDTVYGFGPPCQPPTSVTISGGGTVASGQSASLTALLTGGNGTFTYAWFDGNLNDTSTPVGTNSPNFTTPPITGPKNYWVKVSNSCGNVTAATSVSVQQDTCFPVGIAGQPTPQSVSSGGSATLTVNATGTLPLTYQWYQATNNTDVSHPVGTNSASFTTPALTQATSYYVKVTNLCGFAISNVVAVSISIGNCTPPSFSIQPQSATVSSGTQTYLIAFAAGATSYQWYKGNAGDVSTPFPGYAPTADRWIDQMFFDLLGRPVDNGNLVIYEGILSGSSRTATAEAILVSTEYRQRLINGFYSTFLRRVPSASEVSFWLPAFIAGLTDEQIEAQFVASPEYFALAGSTNAGWINRVFNDVLGRSPSATDVSNVSAILATNSRMSVGLSILSSSEAVNGRVQQYFMRFLRRGPSAADAASFASALLGGATDEQIIATIVASDEYFNFGTILITDVLSATTRYWVRATNGVCSSDSSTAILTIPQCAPPVITTQSQNPPTVHIGTPVSISVVASNATSYQWYRASSGDPSNPIAGGTGPVLTVTPVQTGPTSYWVKVTNSCGNTNSATITITADCAPRILTLSAAPTAPSNSSYAVSWNGSSDLDTRYELQEATKADFSDAQTFTITGAPSRNFTHTATADTRYYYRVHAAPVCGGDFGTYSPTASVLVTAPLPSTLPNFNLAQLPCTSNCTVTQQIFIPGIVKSGKTALDTGDTFSVASDKPFMTISPASGPLPSEGTTVTATIDMSQLDVGSTQASVIINRSLAAAKTGALSDPPAPITVPVSVSVVAPVTPTPKDPNAGFNALLIPAIAHADGIGTRFVSDVRLTNTASQSINYQLTYTPNGTDGTVTGKQMSITVAAGDTKALNDIVKDWYGSGVLGEAPQGSLEIRPLNYAGKDPVSISLASVAASRTYAVSSTGTFGQFIPALPLVNFLAKSDASKISLQQVSQSSAANGFRTNLGFIEGSGQPVNFVATLLDDAGHTVAERAYSLKPYESQQQRLDQFFGVSGIADGRVEVRVTSDTGHISAYASVLDNTTTDPLLVFPADPSKIAAKRFVVPGIAEFDNGFSNFHTDMRIYNGGSSPVDVTLTFTGASVPNKVKTIAAGETLAVNNVIPSLWGTNGLTTGGGSVIATTANDSQLVLTARTFSRDSTNGGTFGQFIPGVTAADAVGNGDRALQIVQLEESPAFRSNLGLVEVTGNSASVELLAYTPDSKVAARTVVPLDASQYLQKNQIFKSLGFNNVYNGRITARVIAGTGKVAAYGSVIDNRTTDPTYVPSQ